LRKLTLVLLPALQDGEKIKDEVKEELKAEEERDLGDMRSDVVYTGAAKKEEEDEVEADKEDEDEDEEDAVPLLPALKVRPCTAVARRLPRARKLTTFTFLLPPSSHSPSSLFPPSSLPLPSLFPPSSLPLPSLFPPSIP